jgi:hypothetical protein
MPMTVPRGSSFLASSAFFGSGFLAQDARPKAAAESAGVGIFFLVKGKKEEQVRVEELCRRFFPFFSKQRGFESIDNGAGSATSFARQAPKPCIHLEGRKHTTFDRDA